MSPAACRCQRSARAAVAGAHNLAEDRERGLPGAYRADVEPDRRALGNPAASGLVVGLGLARSNAT